MSKRMKKVMVLLAMGGTTFCFALPTVDFGGFGFGDYGCIRNADLVTFYQGVGDAGIAEFGDTTRELMPYPEGGDFDTMVITPTENLWTGMLNNWVAQQFPLDLDTTGVVRQ